MEPHRGGLRKRAGERPEPRERAGRLRLVEQADGGRDPGFGVVGCESRGFGEDALRGALPPEPLQRDTVEEAIGGGTAARTTLEGRELGGRREPTNGRRCLRNGDEEPAGCGRSRDGAGCRR